jgi:hypothetical protein
MPERCPGFTLDASSSQTRRFGEGLASPVRGTIDIGAQIDTAPETGGARLRRAVCEIEDFSFKFEAEAGLGT